MKAALYLTLLLVRQFECVFHLIYSTKDMTGFSCYDMRKNLGFKTSLSVFLTAIALFSWQTEYAQAVAKEKHVDVRFQKQNFDYVYSFNPAWISDNIKSFDSYHQLTALALARISNIAYWDESGELKKIIGKSNAPNWDSLISIATKINSEYANNNPIRIQGHYTNGKKGIHYLFIGNHDFVVLAFRGSVTKRDWFQDVKYLPYRDLGFGRDTLPDGAGGFSGSLHEFINEHGIDNLKKFIVQIGGDTNSIPIFTTGHSYGAALCELVIPVLRQEHLNYKGTYAFAPPLAIGAEEASAYAEYRNVIYDIINYKDIVTRAGERGALYHQGKIFRFCYNGVLYDRNDEFLKKEHFIKYQGREERKVDFTIKLHDLQGYINQISMLINNDENVSKRKYMDYELDIDCAKPR